MKSKLKFLVAYISLIVSWCIFLILILILFKVINADSAIGTLLLIVNILFGYIYDKYKPMSFAEVIFKYIGIKLPTWETISYKLKVFIGIDPDYLDKDKK